MNAPDTGRIGGGSAARSGSIRNSARGRFYGTGQLTESQAEFVEHFVNGSTQTEAARRAGYSSPASEAWRLLRLSHVQDAIEAGFRLAISIEGAQLAWRTMSGLMEDASTPAQVQFQAARWVLEAAGIGLAPRARGEASFQSAKPLQEMTHGELETFISEGRAALVSRAVESERFK